MLCSGFVVATPGIDSCQSHIDIHAIVACDGKVMPPSRGIPPLTNEALFRQGPQRLSLLRWHVQRWRSDQGPCAFPLRRGGKDIWYNVVAVL